MVVEESETEQTKNIIQKKEAVEEEDEREEEVKVLEEVAGFEEVVVWAHDGVVDGDDVFVKGMEEWIMFAEAVSLVLRCW